MSGKANPSHDHGVTTLKHTLTHAHTYKYMCTNTCVSQCMTEHRHLPLCCSWPLLLLSFYLQKYASASLLLLRHNLEQSLCLSVLYSSRSAKHGEWSRISGGVSHVAHCCRSCGEHRRVRYSPCLSKPSASLGRRGHSLTFTRTTCTRTLQQYWPIKEPCSFRVCN